MATPPKNTRQYPPLMTRDRLLILALALLVVLPLLAYTWFAMGVAREMRVRHALERNRATAQLAARLLDEQWDDVLSLLDVLSKRQLESALRAEEKNVMQAGMRDAVELVPDLLFLAAYRPDGTLVAGYPPNPAPPKNAAGMGWFRGVSARRSLYLSEVKRWPTARTSEIVSVAVPLGKGHRLVGYMLAYYRLGDFGQWLQRLQVGGGSILYIADTTGRVIYASGDTRNRWVSLARHPALRLALTRPPDTLTGPTPDGQSSALVGYAYARKPQWVVIVSQPLNEALAPTNYLTGQLSLVAIPILALMGAAAWSLSGLYQRQRRMALQLAAQNERLRAADRAKSDFLANVSHDLRTPLASMQASLSSLLDPEMAWDPEQIREYLRMASEEVDQLTARVRNLLEMGRIESNPYAQQKVTCDLTDIVGSALERLEPMTRNRTLDARFPPEPLLVECDYVQIETVILNLLENALKYSPPGTPIHLRGKIADNKAVFSIQDEGPGVKPGDMEHVFEKFYRSDQARTVGGTGLGLAICKAIIEAHAGEIGVRRALEGGAEFWFTLPAFPRW
jgi:signal transduction histidine kinase